MNKKIVLFYLMAFMPFFAFSQNVTDTAIQRLKNETGATISVDYSLGNAHFIRFPKDAPLSLNGNALIEKVNTFFSNHENVFIPSNDLSHWVQIDSKVEPVTNHQHLTLIQQINGISVYGAMLKFHFNQESKLLAINGWVIPGITTLSPTITENEANEIAIQLTEKKFRAESYDPLFIEKNSLQYYRTGMIQNNPIGNDFLIYEIEVTNKNNVRDIYLINALDGSLVEEYSSMCSALHRTSYVIDLSNKIWEEGEAFPPFFSEWQQREVIATEDTYNFFQNAFGYTSFDNNDAEMIILHKPANYGCPNASWNGSYSTFCVGAGTDDITGHEWAHAYTQFTSGLIYAWQSGAMNEAYSDIWGETIDLLNDFDDDDEDLSLRNNCNDTDRWMMGEDAAIFGGAIRDLWLPSCFNDPDEVIDSLYYCTSGDNGGVHSNSGVINHAYALLVDGGNYNGQTINGIGLTKAAHVFWRAQNIYLTPISDFVSFSDALEASCTDLLGINLEGLSTDGPIGLSGEILDVLDLESVTNVITALELREEPDCNFQTILDSNPPPLCEGADSIFYENFENGLNGWIVDAMPSNPSTWDFREWTIVDSLPDERAGKAMFVPNPIIGDCQGDLENGVVILESPIINIPDGTDIFPHLSFKHYVATEPLWDGGNIKYRLNGADWELLPIDAFIFNEYNNQLNPSDNPLGGQHSFTGVDQGGHFSTWGESQIDLGLLGVIGGSSIQFRWELGEDGCNGRVGWYVDDILLYICSESGTVNNPNLITNDEISISPNPFTDAIRIELNESVDSSVDVSIYNISGALVFSKNQIFERSIEIRELDYLPTGIYVLKTQIGDKFHIGKVVKL